ncbi:betaine-aldehyde dehydrogenase [Leisingera daeponensis]|uniref:Betaine-aldehyde dehydrogenase n=1 Tax=Leisingera daeponensis TaxID=405746 RepID=A0ABS7NIQ2_9RHOB|nr:betaine-aldehyde dehydrogenase [Leisingera daeponensis]MBY6141076.1 betaine-aldehyde dehydrogenase [Leisingera daeponensis]
MPIQPQASHYIGGRYIENETGEPIDSRFPATGEVIATVRAADAAIVDQAVAAARKGYEEWSAMSGADRGRVLCAAARILRDRNEELAMLETMDTGRPLQETRVADAASAADCLEFFGGMADKIRGEQISGEEGFIYTRREPFGICAGIGAWNYPIQNAGWKAAPALACGNAMIFKPSETTPLSTLKLAEILTEAGAPDGVFNVIQGRGKTGQLLAEHPGVEKVSFTGSVPTGLKVNASAASQLKHTTMELGGKSPLIVYDDADIESAVIGALLGNFYSTGQVCTNCTRVYVHETVMDQFLAQLSEMTRRIRIGDPRDPETQMGPLVSDTQLAAVMSYIEAGKAEGAHLFLGGGRPALPGLEDGSFIEPTIFTGVRDEMRIAREEIFGPVMCVMSFAGDEEVIERANNTAFGLAAGVFTKDLRRAHRTADRLQAGICWINNFNVYTVQPPFGGFKKSGIGRENGFAAIEYYSQVKTVFVHLEPLAPAY